MKVPGRLSTIALMLIFPLTLLAIGLFFPAQAAAAVAPRLVVQNAEVHDDYVTLQAEVNVFSSNYHVTKYGFYHSPDNDRLVYLAGADRNWLKVGDALDPGESFSLDLYTDDMDNFDSQEPYYYMAYIIYEDLDFRNQGIAYGLMDSFEFAAVGVPEVLTGSATDIDSDAAVLNGKILSLGDSDEITDYGFYYGTSPTPASKKKVGDGGDQIAAGESFEYDLSGLQAETRYYFKAYARNSEGTAYGKVKYFTTAASVGKPKVTTKTTTTGAGQATLYGVVSDTGNSDITSYGFYYGLTSAAATRIAVGRNVDEGDIFSYYLSGLQAGETYYVKAYATNDEGTAYGSVQSFTLSSLAPGGFSPSIFTIGSNYYYLLSSYQLMDVAPYVKDNRTYMPLRYAGYAMGLSDAQIKWDETAQRVTLTKGATTVTLYVGSRLLLIDGTPMFMDVAPELTNGRTCLPIAWVARAFGYTAVWDPLYETVTIR